VIGLPTIPHACHDNLVFFFVRVAIFKREL